MEAEGEQRKKVGILRCVELSIIKWSTLLQIKKEKVKKGPKSYLTAELSAIDRGRTRKQYSKKGGRNTFPFALR